MDSSHEEERAETPRTALHERVERGGSTPAALELFDLDECMGEHAMKSYFVCSDTTRRVAKGLRVGTEVIVLPPCTKVVWPSPVTGLHAFHIDRPTACADVARYMLDPANRSQEGFLVVDEVTRAGQSHERLPLPGYAGYNSIYAKVKPHLQASRSTRVNDIHHLKAVMLGVPGMLALLLAVLTLLGVEDPLACWERYLRGWHGLVDDDCEQLKFTWHDDVRDLPGTSSKLLTAVVQCSATHPSAMCMWGFQPHVYEGCGSATLFRGMAMHQSVRWKDAKGKCVVKAVFFLEARPR